MGMDGAQRIAAERLRQIDKEGWTPEHDDEHCDGELALAACCYAAPVLLYRMGEPANRVEFSDPWPWDARFDGRPHPEHGNCVAPNDSFHISRPDRIRQLEKAGALIAAEIDRLLRRKSAT